MSKNNDQTWNTKYGARRVRQEAPTLAEAIAAAQGLSDEINEQAEIAASLIGLPAEQVRGELLKLAPPRKDVVKSFVFAGPALAQRTVVVERKSARRGIANGTGRPASTGPRPVSSEPRSPSLSRPFTIDIRKTREADLRAGE